MFWYCALYYSYYVSSKIEAGNVLSSAVLGHAHSIIDAVVEPELRLLLEEAASLKRGWWSFCWVIEEIHPGKLTWEPQKGRFGRWLSFSIGWFFWFQPLIFRCVSKEWDASGWFGWSRVGSTQEKRLEMTLLCRLVSNIYPKLTPVLIWKGLGLFLKGETSPQLETLPARGRYKKRYSKPT